VRGRVYLNFGDDYKSDFTATIPPDASSTFRRSKFDPLALEGKVIRVRGYLRDYNGPVIDLTHHRYGLTPPLSETLDPRGSLRYDGSIGSRI